MEAIRKPKGKTKPKVRVHRCSPSPAVAAPRAATEAITSATVPERVRTTAGNRAKPVPEGASPAPSVTPDTSDASRSTEKAAAQRELRSAAPIAATSVTEGTAAAPAVPAVTAAAPAVPEVTAAAPAVPEVTEALETLQLPSADQCCLPDPELAGDAAELLSAPGSCEGWVTPPPAELTRHCSTDASETSGSPFTALSLPAAGGERLYPDLAAGEQQQEREPSPAAEEVFEPSAPAAESPVPLALSASQVSISEGPFSFETDQKDRLLFLGGDVAPMTDAQLADYYHSEELRRRHEYVGHFVAEYSPTARPDGELSELLEGYRRAGVALRAAARRQSELHAQYEARRSQCWELERRTVRGEADCEDGRTMTATHEFRSASFDAAALEGLRTALSALRRLLYEEYSLHAHSVLLARLQVETYLHQVAGSLPEVTAPPPAEPRLQYDTPAQESAAAALRACCAVLFTQQRRCAETEFTQQTRCWLLRLAAPLLRLGTVNDHLFLLHQALRCPSGSAAWTAALLQPPRPDLPRGLDHVLTGLAVLLSPVRDRDVFLSDHRSAAAAPEDGDQSPEEEWVLLDDEDSEAERTAGFLKLQEADLVTLFNQLPWGDVLRHLLRTGRGPDGTDVYDPGRSESGDLLRLFACTSQMIGLLAAGLAEYSGTTHRQLNKRMCHQLLHLVHYVTDHWESYSMMSSDDMATKSRLMVEYDSFVCRSAVSVLCSPRLAVWQFLASFPFGRLTSRTCWKLLWLFHTSGRPQEATALPAVPHDQDDVWAAEIFSPTFHALFEHQLVHMTQSEVYFRLTALSNMAAARPARERTFIKAVTRDLLQVSFVTPTTRELCSRSGRDLLAAICNRHPFMLSYILSLTQEHLHTMGKSGLFLFSGLPLRLWRPSGSDLSQICSWLTDHAVCTVESRLAQLVLSRLDWSVRPYTGQLCLPAEFHRRAALATVSAQSGRAPEACRAPGLVGEGRRQAGALAALVADSPERAFQDWAWAQLARLRLHVTDQPDGGTAREELMARLPRPDDPEVSALAEAGRREQPLACYATLLMTSEGHSVPSLHGSGLARLSALVACGRPAAVAHLTEVILPLFAGHCTDEELSAGPLPGLIQTVVSADRSYLRLMKTLVTSSDPGPLVRQLAGVIEGHITSPRCYGQPSPAPLAALWLRCLTGVSGWSRDPALLYLLNSTLRAAFCRPEARREAENIVTELVKSGSGARQPGGLASLLSWVSGGTLQPLLPSDSLPAVPWLAWFTLRAETRAELQSGLWHDLIATLCEDRRLTLDQALKHVCSQQRLPLTPVSQLSLYRWAQQALDTELDCPLLPVLWQHFFSLYLARVYDVNGRDLGSAGDRFLEGLLNVPYVKRLKRRLQETADHYTERAELAGSREGRVIDGEVEQLRLLARLFCTFSLWLEEPRLHRPDVSLPDLPAGYSPQLLLRLLESAPLGEVWEEYVNYWSESRLSEACLKQRTASHHDHRAGGAASSSPVRSDDTPAARIVKRLQSYDARVPPPPLVALDTPVPRLTAALFTGPEAALEGLQAAFTELAKHASRFSVVCAEHSSLDSQYLELLPHLYSNELTQVVQRVPCEPPGRAGSPDHRCTGPAAVILECETARLDGGVYHRIDDNRQQASRLERASLTAPPQTLGAAAVTLETFIKSLVRRYRQDQSATRLQRIGARLFHHVVRATTEESLQCPPVDQLLSACLGVLGQMFVQHHPSDCGPVLEALLRPDSGCPVERLAEHFTPATAEPETYVTLYEAVSRTGRERAELARLLLDKFGVESWLSSRGPLLSHRSALITVLVTAVSALGPHPEPPHCSALHQLYRHQLDLLHQHQFPEHYGELLHRLLDASRAGQLSPLCWYDFVNVLSAGAATFTPQMDGAQRRQAVAAVAERPGPLRPQESLDTCRLLASRLLKERLEAGLYGLYPRYKLYTAPLSALLGVVASSALIGAIHSDRGTLSDKLVSELWLLLRDTFGPWLWPLSLSDGRVRQQCAAWLQQLASDRQLLAAWVPGDGPHALMMLDMFLHCVLLLHSTLPAGRSALSLLWEHYCTSLAVASVPDHVLALVHAELLTLPWERLVPTLQDAERCAQLLDVYLPEAHCFTAQVVVQLPWREVVEAYDRESHAASVRLHACLFNILIKVAFEPKIRQSGSLFLLLSRAEAFRWHLLDAATYQRVLGWYIMSCDPASVLETEDREPVDVALMGFLQVAAGHVVSAERLHPETAQKRAAYTSGLVRMLANAAATNKSLVTSQRHGFSRTLLRLLRETEAVIGHMPPEEGFREAKPLMREFLQCVSARTPAPLQELCADRLVQWVEEESSMVLLCPMLRVSGTIVHDMQHLSDLWQAIISALFSRGSGVRWEELVQLAEFPVRSVSRLLSASLSSGHLLVLHLYLLQRREVVTDPTQLADTAVSWLTDLTTLRESVEPQLCLLLDQTLYLLERLADTDHLSELGRHIQSVSAALIAWGEERDNTGLLGAIGLGRRSTLSPQFRLLCRVVAATLLCQLCTDGTVTLKPRPAVESSERLSSDSSASSTDSKWGLPLGLVPEAYAAFERVTALRSRREYSGHLQTLEEAVADLLSCGTTLRSCRPLLRDLVRRTYQEACLHQLL